MKADTKSNPTFHVTKIFTVQVLQAKKCENMLAFLELTDDKLLNMFLSEGKENRVLEKLKWLRIK